MPWDQRVWWWNVKTKVQGTCGVFPRGSYEVVNILDVFIDQKDSRTQAAYYYCSIETRKINKTNSS